MGQALSDNNEPVSHRNSRANLKRLLDEIIEYPERRDALEKTIDTIFGQEKAILVLDMSGFSRTTQRYGIVQFLLMIHQMQLIAEPCVIAHRGLLVKAEADNLFCLFDTVPEAVSAAQDAIAHLSAANILLPEDKDIYVSIGIGYGRILNVDDHDLYSNEVNLTCKLGEDVADRGQILLTSGARARLGDTDLTLREELISISGLTLPYYRILNS
jgi:class 3 adenylate cyclase